MPVKPLPPEDLEHILAHTRDLFPSLSGARIFITGGTGLFGHWLLESLLRANRELGLNIRATVLTRNPAAFRGRSPHIADDRAITLLQGDIRNFNFPAPPFTHILHAATDSSTRVVGAAPAWELSESILNGTRRVLHFARESGATRMLFTSSGAIYGRSSTLLRIAETTNTGPDPLLLSSAYDEAKRMAEHLCIAYSNDTVLEAVIARCFAFVGPHLPLDKHFAIGNFLSSAISGQPIHIKGDGTPRRSWLYMADLAIWLWTLLVRGEPNRAYNVGSDEGMSIAEAARLTASTLRPDLPIQIDGTPDLNNPLNSYVPSIDRARTELNLQVNIPLEEALRRTAAWHGYLATDWPVGNAVVN
ncbi:MAG: NAD(P)-dependent oxidoreductase [Acidobacteriota bacterium]